LKKLTGENTSIQPIVLLDNNSKQRVATKLTDENASIFTIYATIINAQKTYWPKNQPFSESSRVDADRTSHCVAI